MAKTGKRGPGDRPGRPNNIDIVQSMKGHPQEEPDGRPTGPFRPWTPSSPDVQPQKTRSKLRRTIR